MLIGRLAFRRVAEAVESARAQTERIRRLLLPTPSRNPETIAEHKLIVAELAARRRRRRRRGDARASRQWTDRLHKFAAERPELFEP